MQRCLHRSLPPSLVRRSRVGVRIFCVCLWRRREFACCLSCVKKIVAPTNDEGVIGVEGAKDGRRRRRGGDFKHASTEVPLVDDCHCISGLKKGEAERRGPKLRRHARDFTPPKALPVALYLTLQFRCWCSGLAHTRPVVLHPYHNIHV